MKPLLTYEDVGRLFGLSKWWVMKQRRLGKIKPIYFGPMVRFTEEEVERFIQEWKRQNAEGNFVGTFPLHGVGSNGQDFDSHSASSLEDHDIKRDHTE